MPEAKINCILFTRTVWLTDLMQFVSWFGNGTIPVLLTIAVGLLLFFKDKTFAWVFWATAFFGYLARLLAQNMFKQTRPWVNGCELLTKYSQGYGFPSGHVTFYTIFFGFLIYFSFLNKKERWALPLGLFSAIILALGGYSRVYLGAHWPKDVIFGYVLGGVFLLLGIRIYQILKMRYDEHENRK